MKSETFAWHFDAPAEKVWQLLADTERFNEAAGLPKYQIDAAPGANGDVSHFGTGSIGFIPLEWEEIPTNWVANRWFCHERRFSKGPLSLVRAELKLLPDDNACRAEYTLTAEARNAFGRLILATNFFPATREKFARLARTANAYCIGDTEMAFVPPRPVLASGASARIATSNAELRKLTGLSELVPRLVEFITTRSEMDVRRIRPLELSREWDEPVKGVLKLLLHAARAGMLALQWDLLCPRCQSAKSTSASLDELPDRVHCPSCNIDYGRDFARNVELTFRPSRAIRPVSEGEFCLYGPMTTPHVKAQVMVPAGQHIEIDKRDIAEGDYRVRLLRPGPETQISHSIGSSSAVRLRADDEFELVDGVASPGIRLSNDSSRDATFVIEDSAWHDDVMTADQVLANQDFRDVFGSMTLRPGDFLSIECAAFLFVDLKGSTALYEAEGDAAAFEKVRTFFEVVAGEIRHSNGAVVKIAGDALHACFADPADAVSCAKAILRKLGRSERGGNVNGLAKIGISAGPSIAVTLNDQLDYYGRIVNQAARLCDLSRGGEIVVAEKFLAEIACDTVIRNAATESDQALFKGIDEPIGILRIRPAKPSTAGRPRGNAPATRSSEQPIGAVNVG